MKTVGLGLSRGLEKNVSSDNKSLKAGRTEEEESQTATEDGKNDEENEGEGQNARSKQLVGQ